MCCEIKIQCFVGRILNDVLLQLDGGQEEHQVWWMSLVPCSLWHDVLSCCRLTRWLFFTKHAPKNLTGCTGAPEIQRFVFKPFLSCMYFKLKTPRSTGLSISWQTFTWCVMKAKLKWFIFCTWYSPTVNQAHQCDQFDSWERSCVAAGEPVQLPAERLITFLGRHKTRQR